MWVVHIKGTGTYSPSPEGGSGYINYWEFSCMGDLSILLHLFIYLVIYLYQYGLTDTELYLYTTVFIKLFQLCPLGILLVGACIPLLYPHYLCVCVCFVFCTLLGLSATKRCSKNPHF